MLRKCVWITALCLKLEIPNGNLSVEKNQYVSPETVTIQCDPGYRTIGSQSVSSSENKTLRMDVPKCKRVNNTHSMNFRLHDTLK